MDIKLLLHQLVRSQEHTTNELRFTNGKLLDITQQINTLHSKVHYLENSQINHTQPSTKKAHAITLRSSKQLPLREPATITADSDEQGGEDLQEEELQSKEAAEEIVLDHTARVPGRTAPNPKKISVQPKDKSFEPSSYVPPLPFPGRIKKHKVVKYKKLFEKHLKDVELHIPLLDVLMLIPPALKYIKDMDM